MNKENYLFGGVSAYSDLYPKLRNRRPLGKYLFHNSWSLTPYISAIPGEAGLNNGFADGSYKMYGPVQHCTAGNVVS